MKNCASWSLLDIGDGSDDDNDDDDDDYSDSDNSYDHNHHPSAFKLLALSSLVFKANFYIQWPANAGFWFEPGCLLNSALTLAKTVVTILGMVVRYWQVDGTYGCHKGC